MRATRALIRTSNLKYNLEAIRQLINPGVKICLAVKANGYGHGAVGISRAALNFGTEYLAVAAVCEAEELRQNGITAPIMILSPFLPEEAEAIAELNLEAVISTENEIKILSESDGKAPTKVHLKIDTGMGRIGCRPEDASALAKMIIMSERLKLAGTCTHFPVSDSRDNSDIEFTRSQIKTFNKSLQQMRAESIDPGIVHAANSGAILNYPEAHFDMVRPGIFAYGYLPGGKNGLINGLSGELHPKPVMSLESRLMHIKKAPKETSISYGRTYKTTNETWIGTIPAGYADGYTRILSNSAKVLIRGKRFPVAGTVCMDQLMVDLGPESGVELYDRVILFGSEEGASTAEELTRITGTIPYELLCGISRRVPRIFDQDTPKTPVKY